MTDKICPQKNRLAPKCLSIAIACLPCALLVASCEGGETGPEQILSLREQIASTRADIERIQNSSVQARAIEAWVSASLPIQPLIVAISRAVSAPSTLKELELAREADSPGRVRISLELSSDDPESQMVSILEAIHNLGFREQSVTQTDSDGAIKFDAILVRKDSAQASVAPPPPTNPEADEDETSLRAALLSLQDYARALTSQNADALNFAHMWQPYFALTDEANVVERGISMKLRESELAVPRSSFKIVDCSTPYPRWSEAIPQVSQGEVVIEDNYAKVLNWLGMMENARSTMRICKISISQSAGKDNCRFDLVLELPLLKKSPN
jgi:hypothetical protein